MILIKLFFTFIKIGLFSFGGGYAMIPLIQKEIESNAWLTSDEFIDIIAIAEMTPGPIAVNSATFVGYKTAGFFGGLSATIGVAVPSLVLIMVISKFFFKFQKHPLNKTIFYFIRPVIVGLITTAAIFVSETVIFNSGLSIELFTNLFSNPLQVINAGGAAIFLGAVFAVGRFKVHPIVAILGSGAAGVLLFNFY